MKIIEKIEINYFRSIYSGTMSALRDLNILVGGNDQGKSNVLRALNLFFHNKTDLYTDFIFMDDLTEGRAEEAREAKGRATIWIKITFNNFLGWRSLPRRFVIKKTWNRYSDQPEVSYPGNPNIPATTIGRFQNKIAFHYVPAVRGRKIYAHYLSQLYDVLSTQKDIDVEAASQDLKKAVRSATSDMTDAIKSHLGFYSTINLPTNLRNLFESLDFSTKYSSYDIPLQRRGDGVQSRHIPFILQFIANRSSQHHIWAYEEPENSMELSQSFEMANHFSTELSRDNQIFVTTHSPAFYDLDGDDVKTFRVKSDAGHRLHNVTSMHPITDRASADEFMGLAGLIASRTRKLYEQLDQIRSEADRVTRELAEVTRPKVILEGSTDVEHFNLAYEKLLNESCPWAVCAGSNADSVVQFCVNATKVSSSEFPAIGVLDYDDAGRKALKRAKRGHRDQQFKNLTTLGQDKAVHIGTLPLPAHGKEIREQASEENTQIHIEYMYDPGVLKDAIEAGALVVRDKIVQARNAGYKIPMNISEEIKKLLDESLQIYAKEVDDSSKKTFLDWLKDRPSEDFENFRPLFEMIDAVFSRRSS